MTAPQPFHRRDTEDERHHRAFLLYAMQAEDKRSLRAVARALNASDNSVRKWRKRHDWHLRMRDPESCRHACDLYSELYHAKLGGKDVAVIQENLGAEYLPPDEAKKSQVARAVDLYQEVDRNAELARHNTDVAERNRKLKAVLDGVTARVGKGLVDGTIQPRASDLGVVLRGIEALERSEARRLSMLPGADDGSEGGAENVATSQRVLQAQKRGEDVLAAMEEDAEELLLLIRTMRTHEAESNVLDFARAKSKAVVSG